MAKTGTTIVEITDTHVKYFHAKRSRQENTLTVLKSKPIQTGTDDEIIKILSELTTTRNIKKDNLVIIIPRRLTILKQLRLPSHQTQEMKKMIPLQLLSKMPYAVEDVLYDYIVLHKDASGYSDVLVYAVHKDVTNRYLKLFSNARLIISKLTVSSIGALGWLQLQEQRKLISLESPIVLLNIDAHHSEICFCYQGKIYFSRQISFGSKDLTSDRTLEFVNQIEVSLRAYKQEHWGPDIRRVVIVSQSQGVFAFKESLEEKLSVPVEVVDPFGKLSDKDKKQITAWNIDPAISVVNGLGLVSSKNSDFINLTPQIVQQSQINKVYKKQLIHFIFLLAVMSVLSGFIFGKDVFEKSKRLKQIEKQVKALEIKAESAQRNLNMVMTLDNLVNQRTNITELTYQLGKLAPEGISFRSLHLNKDGVITIQGYAEAGTYVNNFQKKLLQSADFEDVHLQFETNRKIFNMELTDFKITTRYVKKG